MDKIVNNHKFNVNQMNVINDCIIKGYNPESFAKPSIDWAKMQLAYQAVRNGDDLSPYLDKFDIDQLEEIRAGLNSGVDVTKYAIKSLDFNSMRHKRMALEYNLGKGL